MALKRLEGSLSGGNFLFAACTGGFQPQQRHKSRFSSLGIRPHRLTQRFSIRDCIQRSTTTTSSDTAPDTQRQVVRDTPIYSSRHARPASRPVRVPSSESDSVARAGHTAAGPATLRPGWLSSVPGTWRKRWRGSRPCAALLNRLTPDLTLLQQVSIQLTRPNPPNSGVTDEPCTQRRYAPHFLPSCAEIS